ncbi:MAG: SdpI family protein [Alphaproteobacteria bacterium]|nr:SdpI family protein [Alphaproteobacteria bacterium]
MNRKTMGLASIAVVLVLAAAAWAVGGGLPAEMQLPTHFGIDGTPDRFAGKWEALLLPAGMAGGLSLLFWLLPALEPRLANLERSAGLYYWSWAALLLLSAAIELVVVSVALRWGLRIEHIVAGAIGVMFVLIGNQLGKSRSMFLVGIRTPWTLASEEVWIRTHRLGGKLMVGGGLVMAVAALLPLPSGLLAGLCGVALAVMVGIPVVYSYVLWRRERTQPSR